MPDELLPCPFCGKPPIFLEHENLGGAVECSTHWGCPMSAGWTPVEQWNTRPLETALAGEVARLHDALGEVFAFDEDGMKHWSEYTQATRDLLTARTAEIMGQIWKASKE
jgi:hypothetical protein